MPTPDDLRFPQVDTHELSKRLPSPHEMFKKIGRLEHPSLGKPVRKLLREEEYPSYLK